MVGLMKRAAVQGIKRCHQSIERAVQANRASSGPVRGAGLVETVIMNS